MFSSLLPNVSSSIKFAQNGPSKPSNRFSVRVFKTGANGPFSYPVSAKPDLGYRAPPPPPPSTQREQQNSNWYPANAYSSYDQQRPRGTSNFAIYPSATGDTFIYEQSTCSKSDIFSTSEFDSSSATTFSPSSAFSPALSSDSTLTLQSTPLPERSVDDQRGTRPSTPAPRPGYTHAPAAPQGAPISRTASTSHHIHEALAESIEEHRSRLTSLPGRSGTPFHVPMPSAVPIAAMTRVPSVGGYIQLPEYAASSMSELEVEERDRIAKLNAEYNAAASASFYTSSASTPHNSPTSGRDYVARVASSQPQPLHPNLHFPVRPSESDFAQPAFYPTNTSHNAVIHDSPPSVERISSQLPPEYQVPHAATPSPHHSSPPSESRVRDSVYKAEPPRMPSYRTSPKNHNESFDGSSAPSSRSAHATYATSAQDTTTSQEYHQDRSHRRSSVIGPRPDLSSLRQSSDVRDYGFPRPGSDHRPFDAPPSKSGSDSSNSTQRDYRRDVVQSPVRESVQTSSREPSRHESLGSDLRRDARTPAPRESDDYRPSGRNSYAPEAPKSSAESRTQSQTAKEIREGSEPRRDTRTPAPREADDYRPLPSRRNSYAPEAPRSPKESRTQSQSAKEAREVYKPGPLSSSPTQMRLSPVDLEPASGRQSGSTPLVSENERSHERPRARASSFSTSVRPSLPVQNAPSDSRYASDYERAPRTSERTAAYKDEESFHHTSRSEPERRSDVHTSSSQAYYTQAPAAPAYESHSSQRQAPTSHQSSSRAIDRTISSQQTDTNSHSRVAAQEPLTSSRSRTPYPESEYQADSSRGRSDGDRQFTTSSQPSRGATPYEQQPTATVKYTDAAGNVRTITTGSVVSEPQRRYSDGDQNPSVRPQLSGRNSAPLLRSVRWNDNLICPSPIFPSQRRKGWFNRRGDQLWTNDGAYKAAPAGQEYPPDLDEYPENGEGWMNEECVRIDLNHRLIPKPPLRSALKQPRA